MLISRRPLGLLFLLGSLVLVPGATGCSDDDASQPGLDASADASVLPDADLRMSPANWPAGDLEEYSEQQNTFPKTHPAATADNAMISGTSSALAVRSGLEALRLGGTAADAALATALAQVALVAGAYVSYAGILLATYYDADTGEVSALNAGYNTVVLEDDPLTIPAQGSGIPSGRTALVPGFFAGVGALHEHFGELDFPLLFQPAIYFAEQGFEINAHMAGWIQSRQDVLSRLPDTHAIFTDGNADFYVEGDWITQPALAETLRTWSTEGADYFYHGTWAQRFVDAVQADGGHLTLDDLDDYEVIWSVPLHTAIGTYEVFAQGHPSLGGVNTVEAINVMEAAGYPALGQYTEDPLALFWFLQIHRLTALGSFNDATLAWIGGGLDLSPASRSTKVTAAALWQKMENGELVFILPPTGTGTGSTHSDSVVAVDQWGNICALTHTINTQIWGETGIFVNGVSIPDSASFQQYRILYTGPGERLPEETNPAIVFHDGEPWVASASIGVTHYRTLPILYNLIFDQADIDSAFRAPELLLPTYPTASLDATEFVEHLFADQYDATLITGVTDLGLNLDALSLFEGQGYRGYWVGIAIDAQSGQLTGVTSNFLNGAVLGY